MARFTFDYASMIIRPLRPINGICVAYLASAHIMRFRRVSFMAGDTFAHVQMIKPEWLPGVDVVTVGALPGKVVRVERRLAGCVCMAVGAGFRDAVVDAVRVAGQAFHTGMPANKGEILMIDVRVQKGYGGWFNAHGRVGGCRHCCFYGRR